MKVIKKITAMMLSIMMVLGMCSLVGATGTGTGETGTITNSKAIVGQDYKIYKMLTLESYAPKQDTDGKEIGLYSYKPAQGWDDFFKESGEGSKYVDINENGYVTWKNGLDETKAAELAQVALEYATANASKFDETNDIHVLQAEHATEKTMTLKFENLPLGYYLVDSSAGALCGLTTTNPSVRIEEKNDVPSVDKKIDIATETQETLVKKSSANLGEEVLFKTTINVQPGAYNYVLHDKMDSNLEFQTIMHVADNYTDNYRYVSNTDFQLINNPTDCTFELKFLDNFYKNRAELINQKKVTTITVQYYAIVKDSAPINTAMENTAWLTYGDKNTESNKPVTETYTYGIPVFKHTMENEIKTGLAGAKFSLYTDNNNAVGTIINFKKTENEYRYTKENVDTAGTTTTLQSPEDGNFNINGLKAGTYWLKETEAPKGYNKLAEPIKIIIEQDTDGAKIMKNVKGDTITKVEVENKSGSILPSTGGIGTTIFYIAGAFLVLVSGVVLIAKKRTDSK